MTPHNIVPVFQALTGDWDEIGGYVIVPHPRAQLFRDNLTTLDELTEAAGKYFSFYGSSPSWKWLSVELYKRGETRALHIARPHIQTVRGM